MTITHVLIVLFGIFVLTVLLLWGFQFSEKIEISKKLVQTAKPFERMGTDYSISMLVLGDSTAVGVGADKREDSVAGDYDCEGKNENGPNYTGKVQVLGPDVFYLDKDKNGWACDE